MPAGVVRAPRQPGQPAESLAGGLGQMGHFNGTLARDILDDGHVGCGSFGAPVQGRLTLDG